MVELHAIPHAIEMRLGLPRPAWDVVWEWIEGHVPGNDQPEAWNRCVDQWIAALHESLPRGYVLEHSDHFRLLGGVPRLVASTLSRCEHYRRAILDILAGVAQDDDGFAMLVLHFHNRETYLDYIMDFYPEAGEFADSGGMYFEHGCSHLAVWGPAEDMLERVLPHELTHALLGHLPLPLWLNEGVTQVVADLAVGRSQFQMTPENAREHRRYWNETSIQGFWSGASFYAPDEGQGLSYGLAEVLVRNVLTDFPGKIAAVVNSADAADAGEDALRQACGTSLSNRVGQFLGPGAWGPLGSDCG
jgi:hypothetical protein